MSLRLVIAACALAAAPALAQPSGAPAAAPKPSKADAQKVVQAITSDKAKSQAFCDLAKLDDDTAEADSKNDQKKVDDLKKQAATVSAKIPEYMTLIEALQPVDRQSPEGKEISHALEALDDLCSKK